MAVAAVVAAALLFSKHIKAAAVPAVSNSSNPRCVELTLPVSVAQQNAIYNIEPPSIDSTIDAIAYALNVDGKKPVGPANPIERNISVSETFDIAAKLCIPKHGSKKKLLHIATHGGAFDQRYWDAWIDPKQYSYVENTLDAGYSILTYDRLGTGQSDKSNAYKVLQLPLEVEVLRAVTQIARDGELMQHANMGSNSAAAKFDKLIHVGHSIGSTTTIGFLTNYGNQSDGAVITGWDQTYRSVGYKTTAFDLAFPAELDSDLFGGFGSGYVVPATKSSIQQSFFSTRRNHTAGVGGFTPETLEYAESIKQPFGVVELLSAGRVNLGPAEDFSGPVQFILGEFDWLICDGDCRGTIDMAMLKKLWPKAPAMESYVHMGTGHGLPLHRGANIGYKATNSFLSRNGL